MLLIEQEIDIPVAQRSTSLLAYFEQAIKDHLPEKDGIFAGLLVAEMMASSRKSIQELIDDLFREYGKRVGGQKSMPLSAEKKKKLRKIIQNPPGKLGDRKVVNVETIDGLKLDFSDDDWFLLRFSGTEPCIRCYAESGTQKELERLMNQGLELIA